MKFRVIFFIFLLAGATAMLSCRTRISPAQKQAYKMEKQMKKDNQKMVDEYLQHHYDIQHVNTQKMMKKSRKQGKKTNVNRKDSWVNRTFKRKRSKSCDGN
ncbi:MAG: hypothetical protein DRJ15_00055 [Bacteroidetes bacterium]|nr:MAG: hypothetical protein DRJ15_00055 [Bacteroidota bacterium]